MRQLSILLLLSSLSYCHLYGQDDRIKDIDFLINNPYIFLGKTDFQISSQGKPTGFPSSEWNIESGIPKAKDQYSKYFRIQTASGTVIYLMIHPTTSRVFVIDIGAIFDKTFQEIKDYLSTYHNITFNEFGFSQILEAKDSKEKFIIKLTTKQDEMPSIHFYGYDSTAKMFRFMEN